MQTTPLILSSCLDALARFEGKLSRGEGRHEEVLFLSLGSESTRAQTFVGQGDQLPAALQDAWGHWSESVQGQHAHTPEWVRVDRVMQVYEANWGQVRKLLAGTKTNYFTLGIAWDAGFKKAFMSEELWGRACLYSGDINACVPHDVNLRGLSKAKYGEDFGWPEDDATPMWLFQTKGVFLKGGEPVVVLDAEGTLDRVRSVNLLETPLAIEAVKSSGDFLARQVTDSGRWVYGWYPCFDRMVPSYNSLRHASAAYSLLEAWDLSREPVQLDAASRAINYLCHELIKPVTVQPGEPAAVYLIDEGGEIKLGGNGVAIVAIAKRIELTGQGMHLDLIQPLAEGLIRMQNSSTGSFVHVLQYPSLALKEEHRTIYYDGEAVFGLLKAFELTGERRYLDAASHAVEHFIQAEHWRAHDHWLAYGINELTRHLPEERYFRLGLQNVNRHLPFIRKRLTAYPTLLELMMAASAMLDRMDELGIDPSKLEPGFDRREFEEVLHFRARHLFSGYFFPELAMFFRNPMKVCNTFFIRHYSFRVRIDDVQHYISGLAAYHKRFVAHPPANVGLSEDLIEFA